MYILIVFLMLSTLLSGGLAFHYWSRCSDERAKNRESQRTITALNATIVSLQERVQDERTGVAELFLNQQLVL